MRQLSEDQSQNMTRRAEHPRLSVYSELIGKFRNQISWNFLLTMGLAGRIRINLKICDNTAILCFDSFMDTPCLFAEI